MISKKIRGITPSVTLEITAKAKVLKSKGIDVINFAAGEPDFDTPGYIKKAAVEAIDSGFTKYTPASGIPELKDAVCNKFYRDNGLEYKRGQVVISCGAKHALYGLFQALCEEGDEVLVPAPYWLSYPEIVKLSGAEPVIVETDKKTFLLNPDKLESRINKKTKAMILNSPSNPAGAVYPKDILKKLAEIAVKHEIFVISDEIYEKMIYDGFKHISIASLNEKIYELTIVINGVSKSHAMTGWRIGYLAGSEAIIKGISALQSHSTSNPASISQAASLAAIEAEGKSVDKMRAAFEKRRDLLFGGLNEIKGIRCSKPHGAFYCFADISETGMDGFMFTKKLLEEKYVAAIPGRPFGMNDHVRFSFAAAEEDIRKGINRLKEWVKQ